MPLAPVVSADGDSQRRLLNSEKGSPHPLVNAIVIGIHPYTSDILAAGPTGIRRVGRSKNCVRHSKFVVCVGLA